MSNIKFGTDGWRAIMGKEFTFENAALVAQAFGDYLKNTFAQKAVQRLPRIAIGFDYRKDSENFARTLAEVLIANNVKVSLSASACPTPAVSFTIVDEKFDAGLIVTASHNPAGYNGIKIKTSFGGSADKQITRSVEELIGRSPVLKQAFAPGNPEVKDFNKKYLEFLKKYIRLDLIREAPFRVLVDSMHGVGSRHIEAMLAGGKIKVTTIRHQRDITFGGAAPEPIPNYLALPMDRMKKNEFDLAVVTDGDADRVGAIRPGGEFISPGIILSLILIHFVEDLKRTGSVVTTVSNTALIYKVAKKYGLKVHETPVGFKYICEIMRRENVLIGGEESGGIGFQDYLYERDGLLSGLLLIEMMAMRRKTFDEILKEVEKEFGKLYYVRRDLDYPNEAKARLFDTLSGYAPREILGHRVKAIKKTDGVKIVFEDDSWLLFRLSGTEPILRVYSEARSRQLADDLVKHGEDFAFQLA